MHDAAADEVTDSRPIDAPRDADRWPAARCAVYTLLLVTLAIWVLFTNLGGPRMEPDEARYALCVDQMRQSGEWLSLSPHPPQPYFEKPPLYMWLTAATYDRIPGFEAKYRFWSAALGVACIGLTCVLGAALLWPEAGLLGGAFLLINHGFLLDHGARHGGMDSGLTLLMQVILLAYWVALTRPSRAARWGGWVAVGVAAGLACLFKPLLGGPMVLLIAVHALTFGRRGMKRSRIVNATGLLIASLVTLLVAAPWYIVQWHRFGRQFTDAMFGASLVKRVTVGLDDRHLHGPGFYLSEISTCSGPFLLFLPAALGVAIIAYRATRMRRDRAAAAYGLLAVVTIGWVGLLTVSRSKFLHYAYPAFPAIALSIAALLAAGVRALAARARDPTVGAHVSRGIWLAIGVFLFAGCCHLGFAIMPQQQKKYMPWEIYRTFRPAIEDGRARLIFCGVSSNPRQWDDEAAIDSDDMFYLAHMRGGTSVPDVAALAPMLAEHRPTVVLLSRLLDTSAWTDSIEQSGRSDNRFVYDHRAFMMATVDAGALFHQRLVPGATNPYLQFRPGAASTQSASAGPGDFSFERDFVIRVTAPLPEDCRLTVTLRRAPETRAERARRTIRFGVNKGVSEPVAFPFTGNLRLALNLERDPDRPGDARDVRFRIESADERYPGEIVKGFVTEVRLDVQPRVPVDNPPRLAR